ncbi:MAG: tripartite tricarboxylate transporter substrate binding protein [Burkholderiales bacterium]|nr:tripartite tricarboxylate transporter substrate binding protein [Burkholderiales bacterium]
MNRYIRQSCSVAMAVICAVGGMAMAQNFPTKPVRIVVGLAPGGGTDIVSRLVGQHLSSAIGQQVVIDNRPGASGNIAAELVAKAPGDGYTLIVVTASHAINPSLYSKMGYDPVKDFAAVTQLTAQPYIFVVNPSVPAKSVKEFIALAKARKDGITYASSGAGLLGHLGMELLKMQAKFDAVHVPYKGASPALMDTIAGQVDAFFPTIISGLPQVKSGKVRAIGVTTLKRSPLLPDVQTVAEQGFPDYEVSGWYGLLAPAGTPKEVVAYLHREVVKVLRVPEVNDRLRSQGADGVGSTPEQFGEYVKSEVSKWGKLVKQLGVRAD